MTNREEYYGSATENMRKMQDEHNHKKTLEEIDRRIKAKNRQQKPISADNLEKK